ncbi:ABC transporter permease [Mesorhizobium sp. M0227]|uniref:ABC transporter permease n=1 Tax=unclassified Mesorhizobium TaxID=325217 RepID=UPI00333C0B8B
MPEIRALASVQDHVLLGHGEVVNSYRSLLLRALLRERSFRIGALIIGFVTAGALLAPVVAWLLGHGVTEQFRDTALTEMGLPSGPTFEFPLGADGNGRDVLVRTLYGARVSLAIAIPATTLAMIIGTAIGLVSGFLAGRVDRVISQAVDVALSFPFIVTALSLLSLNRGVDGKPFVAPSLVVVLIITLFSWTYFARLTRGLVFVLRRSPLVEAAQTIGASKARIIMREILPNIAPVILVYWAVQLPTNIIAEATLSFLGVGVQAPQPSWGNMIAEAQRSSLYQLQPWFLLGPGIALFLTVAGFNTLSAGLRNVLDPHRRSG